MLTETSAIDKLALAREIAAAYGIVVPELQFVPVGLEAYCYRTTGGESSLFVRAQQRGSPSQLETSLQVAAALGATPGLEGVMAPLRTVSGGVCIRHRGFIVAVFPWVEAATWYDAGLDDAGLQETGRLLARIHALDIAQLPSLAHEEYRFAPRESLLHALEIGTSGPIAGTKYQQTMQRALRSHRDDILDTLRQLERLGSRLRAETTQFVITHGDVTPGNVLVDGSGRVALVDWVDVMLGPAERDLVPFVEDRFELPLRAYVAAGGRRDLGLGRFAFYQYRWILQELEDYPTRILFGENTPEEEAYFWEDFSQYLPVPHEHVQASLVRVARAMRGVGME